MSGVSLPPELQKLPESIRASIEASKAEYRRMGNSGLKVSVPILGAMSYGRKDFASWMLERDEALPLLKAAYDRGINTWDTSNNYSNGFSEKIVGEAMKKYNMPRQKVIICTKCFGIVAEDPGVFTSGIWQQMDGSKDYVNQRGLSRQAIFNSVAQSLERLQTDYIDLLQIHRFDYDTPIEETMRALNDLVRSGKVRYIGASSMWTFQFAMMQDVAARNGWTKFISMQNHYSLLYREEEREMNKYCQLTGVGLMPWSPLCRGHLARPVAARSESIRGAREADVAMFDSGVGEPDETIIGRVEELAGKKGWTMSQVALAWLNKRVTSPIVGISSIARMDEALGTRGKVLSGEEEKYLEELYKPKAVQGHL